jgi:hypothetical protein
MAPNVYDVLDRDSFADTEERLVKPGAPTTAELAECTCPDFCERDHDTD